MTAILEAFNDKPLCYFELDSTTADLSGNGNTSSFSGTTGRSVGLGNGFTNSTTLSNSAVATFGSPVYRQGYESQPFTLEATVRSIAKTNGYTVQTYRENLNNNPAPTSTSWWYMTNPGTGGAGTFTYDSTNTALVYTVTTAATVNSMTIRNGPQNGKSTTTNTAVVPGQTYYQRLEVMSDVDDARNFAIDWYDANGTNLGSTNLGSNTVQMVANTWTTMELYGTAPVGAAFASINIVFAGTGSVIRPVGSKFYIRRALFEPVSANDSGSRSYFDGSTPGYEWAGTANSSMSRARKDVSLVNLIPNSDLETNTTGWGVNTSAGGTIARSTTTANSGSASILMTKGTGYSFASVPNIPVVYGVTYYISFWARSSEAQFNTIIRETGGTSYLPVVHNVTPNTWQLITRTYTPNIGTRSLQALDFGWEASTAPSGATLYLDDVLFTTSSTATHFNGNSVGAGWSSTVGNSWSYMLPPTADQQILGNSGQYDGLTINGTVVSFTTKYANTGECRASYDMQIEQRAHVVGVHTASKNSLYVNGQLVAAASVSDAQKTDTFASANTTLSSGAGQTSRYLSINGVATYGTALSADRILAHYTELNRNGGGFASVNSYSGRRFAFSVNEAGLFLNEQFQSNFDWMTGLITNLSVGSQQLTPTFTNGLSEAGTWATALPLDATGATSVFGVNMVWDGQGAIVEASLDGITWISVNRGENISIIPPGFNPSGKVLSIRVSFPAGLTTAFLDNLIVRGYLSSSAVVTSDRSVTFSGTPYIKNDADPAMLRDDWGVYLNGGTLILGPETDTDQPGPKAIEFWVKQGTGASLVRSFTASVAYVNGVVGAGVPPVGEWVHVIYNVASPVPGAITVSGDVQIGQIVLYDNNVTAAIAQLIHDSYVGVRTTRMDGSVTITVSEPVNSVTLYAYDWAITG